MPAVVLADRRHQRVPNRSPANLASRPSARFERARAPRWAAYAGPLISLLAAQPVAAYHEPGQEWTDRSAYALRAGEFSLGLRHWAAGIVDQVNVGVNPILWAVGPFFGTVVPNADLKVRDWFHERIAVSASFGLVYLDGTKLLDSVAKDQGAHGNLLSWNGKVTSSLLMSDALTAHLELNYVYAHVTGGSREVSFDGATIMSSLRMSALIEWRLTRVVALRVAAGTLLYRQAPAVTVSYQPDPRTMVDGELHAGRPAPIGACQVLPAIALSGANVNFLVGAGYGYQWLPVLGLVLPHPGLVVDFDLFVRFQL